MSPYLVAISLGVNESTVLRWARDGIIPTRRSVSGRHSITDDTVAKLKALWHNGVALNKTNLRKHRRDLF